MWQRFRENVFPRLLFAATLLVAACLGAFVFAAPWLHAHDPHNRLFALFAKDSAVRRTAVASSVGLAVTALVFFRPGGLRSKKSKTRRPPPSSLAGA